VRLRLARKFGKLHRGNEADIETTAKMVLNDLIRGKLPFFQEPPPPPPPGTVYTKQDLRAHDIKVEGLGFRSPDSRSWLRV